MTLPFTVPDWLPWWGIAAILIPGLVFLLAFVLMPFSVFGVRSRLDLIEARLDEIQGEIRMLALRLPEPGNRDAGNPEAGDREPALESPPIPPSPRPPTPARRPQGRAEPRLDWPR